MIRKFNFNPWRKNIGDCSIRAICAAIGMRYELVCKELKVAWKRGVGLVRDAGIDLELIKETFDSYFDKVEDFLEDIPPELENDPEIVRARMMDAALGIDEVSSGITLAEFMDLYRGQGVFLVGLRGNPDAANPNSKNPDDGHIVCVKCLRGKEPFAIDTFDSSEMICDSFMRVKHQIPKDDPRHWVYDYDLHCFAGYGLESSKKLR